MAQGWQPVEQVVKNDQGEYMALVNNNWVPAAGAAKNEQGQYVALFDSQAVPPSQRLSTGQYLLREAGMFPRAAVEAAPVAALGLPALAADAYDSLANLGQMGANKLGVAQGGYQEPFRHTGALVRGGKELANMLRLPQYETPEEKALYGAATSGLSAVGGAGVSGSLGKEVPTAMGAALRTMGSNPAMQGVSAASGAMGGEVAREMDLSPGAQTAATFMASLAPYMVKNAAAPSAGMRPEKVQTTREAQEIGLKFPPASMKPSLGNRALESMSGKAATGQMFSVENQKVVDAAARKALNLPVDANLDNDALVAYRASQYQQGYEPVKQIGGIAVPKSFNADLDKIAAKYTGKGTIPGVENQGVFDVIAKHKRSPNAGAIDASDAVDAIKILREEAKSLFKKGDNAEALANLKVAKVYEDLIDKTLQVRSSAPFSQNNRDLLQSYRDARKNIAQSLTIENSIKEGTGEVDATRLAAALNKNEPLSGDLLKIAKAANAYKNAMRTPSSVGSPGTNNLINQLATGAGIAGGIAGTAMNGFEGAKNIGIPAYVLAQGLGHGVPAAARKIMASPAFQARVLRAAAGAGPTAEKVAAAEALGMSLENFAKFTPTALADYLRRMGEGQQ